MPLSHTFSISFTDGTSVPSRSLGVSLDNVVSLDAGFVQSGHRMGTAGDPLPDMAKLIDAYASFPCPVRLQTHLSGSYLSGGVATTHYLASGTPFLWLYANSGIPNPFSGVYTALSLTGMSAASGQIYSGSIRFGYSGVVLSG